MQRHKEQGIMAANREQDYITIARGHARNIFEGINALLAMQNEFNALDYGNTLDDGVGENEGILADDVGSVIFATADELKLRIMDTGHKTNLAKLL
jgi:hypothetical protein